jgi:hypothetical protein
MSATPPAPRAGQPAVTIVDDGRPTTIPVETSDGRVRVSARAAAEALGWRLAGDVDLDELGAALGRPVAVDREERAAYAGIAAAERARVLTSLRAPDFTLPDLGGRAHSLATHRGRKVLLVAYASW